MGENFRGTPEWREDIINTCLAKHGKDSFRLGSCRVEKLAKTFHVDITISEDVKYVFILDDTGELTKVLEKVHDKNNVTANGDDVVFPVIKDEKRVAKLKPLLDDAIDKIDQDNDSPSMA